MPALPFRPANNTWQRFPPAFVDTGVDKTNYYADTQGQNAGRPIWQKPPDSVVPGAHGTALDPGLWRVNFGGAFIAYCGGCFNPATDEFFIALPGGHGGPGWNSVYRLRLRAGALPVWDTPLPGSAEADIPQASPGIAPENTYYGNPAATPPIPYNFQYPDGRAPSFHGASGQVWLPTLGRILQCGGVVYAANAPSTNDVWDINPYATGNPPSAYFKWPRFYLGPTDTVYQGSDWYAPHGKVYSHLMDGSLYRFDPAGRGTPAAEFLGAYPPGNSAMGTYIMIPNRGWLVRFNAGYPPGGLPDNHAVIDITTTPPTYRTITLPAAFNGAANVANGYAGLPAPAIDWCAAEDCFIGYPGGGLTMTSGNLWKIFPSTGSDWASSAVEMTIGGSVPAIYFPVQTDQRPTGDNLPLFADHPGLISANAVGIYRKFFIIPSESDGTGHTAVLGIDDTATYLVRFDGTGTVPPVTPTYGPRVLSGPATGHF